MKRALQRVRNFLCCCAVAASAGVASASNIQEGDLIVVQVGDGSAPLSSAATPTFLKEFQVGGALLQTIPMPTVGAGLNARLTNSGTATSEAFLSLSANGQFLLLAGYDAAVGTAGVVSATSATVRRVVARVDMTGFVDTTTALTDAYSTNNIRSAASDDGLRIWTAGPTATGTSGGIRFATFANSTSQQLNSTNSRVIGIFNNQLYVSNASGAFQGISTVGSGLPTMPPQPLTILPGFPTAVGPSSYDYYFATPTLVYVADDRTIANGGGIQRWIFNGTNWILSGTITTGLTAGCRGICGEVMTCPGQFQLYATTAETVSRVVSVIDNGVSGNPAVATVTTCPPNCAFRGIRMRPNTPRACCFNDGSCQTLSVACCTQAGGTPQGLGVTCQPNPCHPAVGACCTPNGCVITTHAACEPVHCFYYGDNSICPDCNDNDPCTIDSCDPLTGGCRHTPINCDDNDPLTVDACVNGDCTHTYVGGACCAPDGSCTITTLETCSDTFLGVNSTCTPNPCPQPLNACCFADGHCQLLVIGDCQAQGGTVVPGGCVPNTCPQPSGACCKPDAACFFMTAADCQIEGGTWLGLGSSCTPNPCFVACCFENGMCVLMQQYACELEGGTSQGYGTTCAPGLCPILTQACCTPNGSCTDLLVANCIANGGTPQGANTLCLTTNCPQPIIACCLSNGICAQTSPAECTSFGGIIMGVSCSLANCPQPIVGCCLLDGTCHEITPPQCNQLGGNVYGPSCVGVSCFVNRCAAVLVGDANCDGSVNNFDIDFFVQGVLFPAPPGDFTPAPNSYTVIGGTQTCWESRRCWGDVNCDGAFNNFDIDAFVACVLTTPAPGQGCPSCGPRACCLPGGICVQVYPAACTLGGGTPQGPGSNCGSLLCP